MNNSITVNYGIYVNHLIIQAFPNEEVHAKLYVLYNVLILY